MVGRPFQQLAYPPQPTWSLLPTGRRIRGANLTFNSTQASTHAFWGSAWDATWVANNITWAKSLGLNTIGIIGPCDSITNSFVSRATAQAEVTTILNSLRSNGLFCAFVMGAGPSAASPATYSAECVSMAALLATYTDVVVGIDLSLEVIDLEQSNGGANAGWLATNGAALRTAVQGATTIPLTFSQVAGSVATANPSTYYANVKAASALLAGLTDYDDIHCYWLAFEKGILQTYWQARPKAKLLVGEAGSQISVGSAANIAFYAAMNAALGTQGPNFERCAGVLWWAISDQDTVSSNQFGLFDASGVVRTAAATAALAPT